MSREVPCIMYHTVGIPKPDWVWSFLTMPFETFDNEMRILKKCGYRTLSSAEFLECHKTGEYPDKAVYLTFDDGYLDNWVFAAPILEKYGFCGTIFVNPDFVDPSRGLRPRYDERPVDELELHGFLNWDEMREMERRGCMEIQSHAMTHTWYFSSPEIVDFHHPGDDHVWMDWNDRPEKKYAYLGADAYRGNWGAPVYAHRKSLSGPMYTPDPSVREGLIAYASERGEAFFDGAGWREEIGAKARELQASAGEGRMETNEEYLERVRWELTESKRVLERELGRSVDVFCWPGGGYSDEAEAIAASLYKGVTVGSAKRDQGGWDEHGSFKIARIGAQSLFFENGSIIYPGGWYTCLFLREYQGDGVARFFRQMYKAVLLLKRKMAR